jgi:hypothetical protein
MILRMCNIWDTGSQASQNHTQNSETSIILLGEFSNSNAWLWKYGLLKCKKLYQKSCSMEF